MPGLAKVNMSATEQELEEQRRSGEHAQRIMRDPMVQKALENMRQTVYGNIRSSHYKDIEDRENLYLMLKAIDAFETEFKREINGGKKAESRLLNLFKGDPK